MSENNTTNMKKKSSLINTIGNGIWDFFASIILIIFTLLFIAFMSIFGTFIEQNKEATYYIETYGETWANVIFKLGLENMYYTWWFIVLLGVMSLNIMVCTFERFPKKWKLLLQKNVPYKTTQIDKIAQKNSFTLPDGDLEETSEKLKGFFLKRGYKLEDNSQETENGLVKFYYGFKGKMGRFGPEMIHISLLTILTGAIIGSVMGYKDFKTVIVGDTFKVPETDYELRLDDFWIDYYDTGQIRQYYSNLEVIREGEIVHKKKIWVNEPLYFEGIRFYQSSYGKSWNRIGMAELSILPIDSENVDEAVITNVNYKEKAKIEGTNYEAEVLRFVADFAFDQESKQVYSVSGEMNNPAILVNFSKNGKEVGYTWLFFNHPNIFNQLPNEEGKDPEFKVFFTGYKGMWYSGISINKDPGTNVVWVGSLIMVVGFFYTYMVYYRRFWFSVSKSSEGLEVKLGGMINKNQIAFRNEFKNTVEELKKHLSSKS